MERISRRGKRPGRWLAQNPKTRDEDGGAGQMETDSDSSSEPGSSGSEYTTSIHEQRQIGKRGRRM
jgi:hypothetical protein